MVSKKVKRNRKRKAKKRKQGSRSLVSSDTGVFKPYG